VTSRAAFVVVVLLFFLASTATADTTSWHGTANGDVAATDNVFAAPSSGSREADVFFTLRPGVLFAYDAPRMIHDLTAEIEVLEFALHSDDPSLSFKGGWRAFFLPGPRSEVITQLNGQSGQLSAIASRSSPDQTVVQVQPAGKIDILEADGSQFASYQASKEIRLSQTVFGRFNRSNDNASDPATMMSDPTIVISGEGGMNLGIERGFRADAISLETGASVARLERRASKFIDAMFGPGGLQGSRLDKQLTPKFRGQWRHDFTRVWSGSIDGGVAIVVPFGTDPFNPGATDRKSGVFPLVGAQLSYSEVWGRAAFVARRDVTPNLFVAQQTVSDSAQLTLALPLPFLDDSRRRAPKLNALGSLGVARTRLVDQITSDLTSSFEDVSLDLGVTYTPRPGFTYGVRYELIVQTGDAAALAFVPGFFRNTLFFTFAMRYPDRVAGEVPQRRANSVRADRKDLVPVGAEPVVPDAVEQNNEEGSEE
jgi:hypothetical protein